MTTVRNIYFRGSLQSCNYRCSYCAFGKKRITTGKEKDEQSLHLFYEQVALLSHPVRIMLIPYGEGLIHSYYQEAMIRLALLPQVEAISCQTNLSFSPDLFLDRIKMQGANPAKIKLWASFHPEMVEVEAFIDKVHFLYRAGIELCVGTVGSKQNKEIITLLRRKLDKRIYLFINAIQGRAEPLDDEDIAVFSSIDPLFAFDLKNVKATIDLCRGGRDTVFIDHSGTVYPCPRNPEKIVRMTGLDALAEPICRKERCDCYIAYSNMQDTSLATMMGEGTFFRIPEKRKVEAIFFDIDGTLTGNDGIVPDNYHTALKLLADEIPLYLATSLPLTSAKRRLGDLFPLFSGGVFADGGHLRYNRQDEYLPLTPIHGINEEEIYIKVYQSEGTIYKYVIKAPTSEKAKEIRSQLDDNIYNVQEKASFLTIVSANAGKKNGLLSICSKMNLLPKQVVAIGNTMHDSPMLSVVGYPCAVIGGEQALRQSARYVLNPDHLPLLFTGVLNSR